MRSSRRKFIRNASAVAVASGIADLNPVRGVEQSAAAGNDAEFRNQKEGMHYRRLGKTGFMVSEVVMGGNEIRPDNFNHIQLALDMGLNYFDTAPAYGNGRSELGYAEIIKKVPRDQFFLNSKISMWDGNRADKLREKFLGLEENEQSRIQAEVDEAIAESGVIEPEYIGPYFGSQIRELKKARLSNYLEKRFGRDMIDRRKNYYKTVIQSVDESLMRLGTDYLDIVMCPHGASTKEEMENFPEVGEAFEKLKQSGKVRFLGVSSHSDPAGVIEGAIESGIYSVAMIAYNFINHRFMDDSLASAHKAGIGLIAMKVARPLYAGPGRSAPYHDRIDDLNQAVDGDYNVPQKAYLWALRNQHLSATICNMVNAEQVKENLILPAIARKSRPV